MRNVQYGSTREALFILAILLPVFFRMFLYHHGEGVLLASGYSLPALYVVAEHEHKYPVMTCQEELALNNAVEYTAIGLDLSIGGQQVSVPFVIFCEFSGWIDTGPLP